MMSSHYYIAIVNGLPVRLVSTNSISALGVIKTMLRES
jgi:hypothetical protein